MLNLQFATCLLAFAKRFGKARPAGKVCNIYIFIIPVFVLFHSCKKDPGEGGKATIKGTLYAGNYHSPEATVFSDDFLADEDVFIVYGNESTVANDDIKTGYNGTFSFKYLLPGKYRIYAYSLDTANASPSLFAVVKEVEISKKDKEVTVDLTVFREADDRGSSTIRGRVYLRDYNINFSVIENEYYAPDADVYIVYGDTVGFNERTRTDFNGYYEFRNLRKGTYLVYAFSEDSAKWVQGQINPPDVAVKKSVTISSSNQLLSVSNMVVLN